MTETEHMTPCTDCGQLVPTIRTGEGDFSLPRCPASSEQDKRTHQDSHRVPRAAFDAALAERDKKET